MQGILAARIDRLPSDAKDLLQTLAVIGREFPLSLIRAVVPKADDELNRLLNDLQLGEFIYEQPAVGDTEYIFKHALTQEVAYNSVLDRAPQATCMNESARRWKLYPANQSEDHLDELAHHYGRSATAEGASNTLTAGHHCRRRLAYAEAIDRARRHPFDSRKSPG